ncbi:uncharacterized protein TRIADDRAFT_58220 [Trichoplax adhaerens]|uniref:Uncharacterized protein n=1 Tax=Trichoplax adhaerens TaxID=10228 RepID=B3S172_TRIAD|nr:predicted protein [Trichoplax adhaerens]EDV23190.1 predicted protein [Trichoplax adhaerens]|eukprot:XP_002114100.1 predicted protein [Trichoplax adhaerens]
MDVELGSQNTNDGGTNGQDGHRSPPSYSRVRYEQQRHKEVKRVRILSIMVCVMGIILVLLVFLHIVFTKTTNYLPLMFSSAGLIVFCSSVLIYSSSVENGTRLLTSHKNISYCLLGCCCILSFATGIVSGFNAFQNSIGTSIIINIFICFFNLMCTWAIYAAGYSIHHNRVEITRASRCVQSSTLPSPPSYDSCLATTGTPSQTNLPIYVIETEIVKLPNYDEALKMKK